MSPSEPLRVALLNPCFWPEVRRGSERLVRDLADGLIARGHRPRLITSHPGLPTRRLEDGLEIVRTWRPPDGRLRRRQFEEHLTHVPFTYFVLRRGKDDVAHALHATDALAATRWRERTGRPVVFSSMGIPHRRWLANRRWRIETLTRAIAGSDALVALSRAAADGFERWLGVRPRVIHPGVDVAAFTPGHERAPTPTILCAAAVEEPRKRVALLVEAFALVRKEHPDARLVLARPRDGSLAPRAEGVELADLDARTALVHAYRSAWVSALPSVGEAFGLVLAEGMACGTPAVGTDDGGIPEIVDRPQVGRLFGSSDPRALARALLEGLELATDPSTPAACRARAKELSLERCVDAHVALYRELGAGRRVARKAN